MPAPLPKHANSLTKCGIAVVTEFDGTITGNSATGVYVRDHRIVDGMALRIDGALPTQLSGTRTASSRDRLTYGHWSDGPDPQAIVIRERSLDDGYREEITIQSFRKTLSLHVEVELRAQNTAIYSLHEKDLTDADPEDLISRMWAAGASILDTTVSAELEVAPGRPVTFSWGINLDARQPPRQPATRIVGSNRRMQAAIDNAAWDLDALTVVDPSTHKRFTAAGSPHFLAMFGRDALTASLLSMLADPNRALDALDVLAAHQGTRHNPVTLEAPGRILHELRIGDMGVFGLEPGVPYYGSIDATPLFVIVLHEAMAWGAPRDRIAGFMPSARAAVDWCRNHTDPRGFLQSIPHAAGIANQGWKDSGDSIVRPDGSVVEEATSPVEVQGYVHQALLSLAELERTVGDSTQAPRLEAEAAQFAQLFQQHFVLEDHPSLVALALDAAGEPIPVRASNVGHLLATEIISDDLARGIADRLMSDAEFSGWGVRTLASSEKAYNPLGYHIGAVWPHDNAVILRGLARRAFDSHTRILATALLDLAAAEHHQLPELLGGFNRDRFPEPVPYPASARPQAWAAAVPFQVVTALVGLQPALHRNELRLRPILDEGKRIVIEDLRLGDRAVTIDANGHNATVTGDIDGLSISVFSD